MRSILALFIILFALIAFALFALPLWGQGDVRVYVLVRAQPTNQTPGPMAQYVGMPVHADLNDQYTGAQTLPNFVQFVITDADSLEQVRDAYIIKWAKYIDYEIVDSDPVLDEWQLKVFTKPELVSQSGLNRLTREEVENYLNNWGATVDSISLGEVSLTARIMNALWSNGFWGRDVSLVDFSESDYDSATGVHTTFVDADAVPSLSREEIAGIIINRCGPNAITGSHPQKKEFTFECGRGTVLDAFKANVKERVDGYFAIRKWTVLQPAIDAATAVGGSMEVTKAQFQPYLRSRLLD